jgi:hypothetical protein
MRCHSRCLAAGAAVLAFMVVPAAAQECCDAPVIVYGAAPVIITLPPTGYVLDPSDARAPVFVVNQGPNAGGWSGALAQPTYSEGGYAYVDDPYFAGPAIIDCAPAYRAPVRHYPYVRSYYGGRWFDAPRRQVRRHHGWQHRYADYRGGPAAAYRYRPAPSARIIRVPPPPPAEMHTRYAPR